MRKRYQSKYFNEDAILLSLNPSLRADVLEYTRLPFFMANKVFSIIPKGALLEMCQNLTYTVFDKHEILIRENSICNDIFFFESGEAFISTYRNKRGTFKSTFDCVADIPLNIWKKSLTNNESSIIRQSATVKFHHQYRSTMRLTACSTVRP